jgi:DNA-directed RNA polymerase specialized sigma24 family protein
LDLPFSAEDLTRLYRFALLLTGEEAAAQQVLYDACADCASRLGGYRNEQGRLACMIGNLRQKAKALDTSALPGSESRGIARAFTALPEEERVALAGLYTGLLPARELAEALKISLEQLGAALKSGRERLAASGLASMGEPSLEQAL